MQRIKVIEHERHWVVCVDQTLVLKCKSRRVAVATARHATRLLSADAAEPEPAMDGDCDTCPVCLQPHPFDKDDQSSR
jgi:hypothetical protein